MLEKIYSEWQHRVTKSSSSDCLPLFQRKDLFINMLELICAPNPDIHYLIPKIIDFVESNSLDYVDFINTLFQLRDVFVTEADLLHEYHVNLEQSLLVLQDIILKIGSYFSFVQMDLEIPHRNVHTIDSDRIEGNIIYLDHNFSIVKTNSTLSTYFGYQKNEVIGKNIQTLFSDSSRTILQQVLNNLKNNFRFKMDIEVEALKKNGQKFQAVLKVARLNTNQVPPKYYAYIKDNTYIYETKNVLNLLNMALEGVGEGIFIVQAEPEGQILYVNEALEKMSGFTRHQLLGKPLGFLRGLKANEGVEREIITASLQSGWIGELENHHKNGNSYIVQLHTRPIKDEYGKIVAIVGIERDITTNKAREAQIVYLKKFVEDIINNLPQFVIVTDQEQKIKFWNQSMEEDLGIAAKNAIGKRILDVLPELQKSHLEIAAANVIESGQIFSKKFMADLKGNGEQYFKLYITPIQTDQERQLLWTLLDITKEELLKVRITWQNARLKFLDNFSQILNAHLDLKSIFERIAHELREILPYSTISFLLPHDLQKLQFTLYFYSSDGEDTFPQKQIMDFSDSKIYQDIVASRKLQIENIETDNPENMRTTSHPERDPRLGQVVHFPICFEKEILGILNLGHTERFYYKQDDLDFLQQIASHLAIALKNSFYFNLVELQNKKLSIINSIYKVGNTYSDIPHIYQTVLWGLRALLGFDFAVFYTSSDGKNWQKVFADPSNNSIPDFLDQLRHSYKNKITFWNETTPDKLGVREIGEEIFSAHGLFIWEQSKALGYIGFLSFNNQIDDLPNPDTLGLIVHDILKQMTIVVDQLHLFEKVKQSEKEWKTTFDTVKIGLAVIDKHFRILKTNRAFREFCETRDEQLIGHTCKEVFGANSNGNDEFINNLTPIKGQSSETEYYDSHLKKRFHRTFYPIFDNEDVFSGGVISLYDITKQHEQETKIKFLSKFPETNPNLVFSVDQDGQIIYINPTAQRLIERLKLKEHQVKKLLPGEVNTLIKHFDEHQETHLEIEHRYRNLVFTYIVYRPQDDDNFYFYGTDITEKMELQRQLLQTERIRAVGEMAAGVAHDFNNLLATILGKAQLIMLKTDNANIKEELHVIEKAAIDGGEIVQRIQEVTREQRDRNYQPLDVNKLIQESIIFSANKLKVSTQLKGKKVHLHSNLDKDLITKGNPVELKEVFTNLLLNAYDAMPNGGDLYISGSKTSDGNIQIVIRDTGTGMSEEIKNKIFNPFFTTKGEKGTGLGLSIVYNTITAHGGHIKLDSELNKGSTFTILLPSTKEEIDQKSAPIEQLQENFGRLRLLIVDDEPELLDTMAEILRLKFQSVEIADSGQSALKKIGSARFDVVLTDLGMPEMSGWELAEKVKEKSPKSHVILVTGWGDQAREELKHHPHVDEILAKPYDLNDLINKINKISQN